MNTIALFLTLLFGIIVGMFIGLNFQECKIAKERSPIYQAILEDRGL